MAAQKPLHQLLQEDQEPFLLTNYIADRRFQLNKQSPARRVQLQVNKLRPVNSVSHNFCFFSINNSPEVKSPIFEFKSPAAKSPCHKTPNSSSIFLHVPAKTASLLLEAAVRIQKQNQRKSSSSKVAKSNNAFGLFGSLIKRITHRKKREIRGGGGSVKDIIHRRRKLEDEKLRFCSDLEASSSSQSDGEDEDEEGEEEFVSKLIDSNGISDFASFDDHFCESPFHFVLRRSPSSGHRTPVFTSPATSPNKGKEKNQVQKEEDEEEEEEEEDKEQNSPVSVLDPPFEDDDEGHDHHCEDDGFDLECSYAFVQRAKQQLLQKLRRFEKLAELDPVELEKRMHEEEQETDDDDYTDEEEQEHEQEQSIHDMIMEQLGQTSFGRTRKIPPDMKRLVSDLINEEEGEQSYITNRESMAKRVCKRFEGWKEVECNTIDMMVEEDFKKQVDEWKKYQKQVGEAAIEIEVSIFKVLVEELSEELVASISSN